MDIESLEAANQSLQVDLKLAFKRIGDLQAAIEDEMESDDNDDLINRLCTDLIFYKDTLCSQRPSASESYLCKVHQSSSFSLCISHISTPPDNNFSTLRVILHFVLHIQ